MLEKVQLEKILFLDIETVPQYPNFQDLSPEGQKLYDQKTKFLQKEGDAESVYDRAGIYAEFGKIICISVGFVHETRTGRQIRLKSYYHDDEATLLKQFVNLLEERYNTPYHILCGHNAKEFDFPYICRRLLINGMKLPNILNIAGKKPWEIAHLDTMELWKFGDYKHFTSLKLLTKVLGIPSPKDDIDGSEVAHVFYVENDIDRIITYCEKDVIAVAQIFLRLRREELLVKDEIIHV